MMHYVSELRHWGLVRQFSKGLFQAMPLATEFLEGRAAIPSWTWPKIDKLPAECVDGPTRYIDEMTDEHPKDDQARHVEEAIPASEHLAGL